jgi:hypothetical protein
MKRNGEKMKKAKKALKSLSLIALGYALHIGAVEAVNYQLASKFGDCVLDKHIPPFLCQLIVEQQVTSLDKAILYMPELGNKALEKRAKKAQEDAQSKQPGKPGAQKQEELPDLQEDPQN